MKKKAKKKTTSKRFKVVRKKAPKKPTIRQGDKCAFVRSLPRSLPATEVQEAAAEKGMKISVPYIHNIRSAAGKKSREILKKAKKATPKGNKKQKEATLRALIVDLGPARAKQIFAQVEVALTKGE